MILEYGLITFLMFGFVLIFGMIKEFFSQAIISVFIFEFGRGLIGLFGEFKYALGLVLISLELTLLLIFE